MNKNIGDVKCIDCAGRVTIPAGIRRTYGFTPGKAIGICMTKDGLLIQLIKESKA